MERIDKAIISGIGVIVLGGGALLGFNMTTDVSESTKTGEYTPRISATKSKTTTVTKQKTTEPVVVEPEAPTTETQINDYFFTETTAVPVAPQPKTHTETVRVPQTQTKWVSPPPPAYTYTPPVEPTSTIPTTTVSEEPTPTESVDPDLNDNSMYKNCRAVWDAIGGPIYTNDPGYSHDLDANKDGAGCEEEPDY